MYILYGYVDMANSVSTATFGAAYAAMLTAIRAGLPNAWIVCAEIPKDNPTGADIAPYNSEIQSVVTAAADPKIVLSTGIYDYMTGASDSPHPNQAQSTQIAMIMQSEIDSLLNPPTGATSVATASAFGRGTTAQGNLIGAYANLATIAIGTVDFGSSDSQAVLPPDFTGAIAVAGVPPRRRPR